MSEEPALGVGAGRAAPDRATSAHLMAGLSIADGKHRGIRSGFPCGALPEKRMAVRVAAGLPRRPRHGCLGRSGSGVLLFEVVWRVRAMVWAVWVKARTRAVPLPRRHRKTHSNGGASRIGTNATSGR